MIIESSYFAISLRLADDISLLQLVSQFIKVLNSAIVYKCNALLLNR